MTHIVVWLHNFEILHVISKLAQKLCIQFTTSAICTLRQVNVFQWSFLPLLNSTVLMEVGPTTILTSSKQEEGLKRMVSAYGKKVGLIMR